VSARPAARLLLDEMFPPVIATKLRDRGHDVVVVADDPQLRAMTDPELRAWAGGQGRRIVTENVRDFRPLVIEDPAGSGVLFTSSRTFARTKPGIGKQIAALEAWITAATTADQSVEAWLVPPSKRRGD
jgi:hypothetical protein